MATENQMSEEDLKAQFVRKILLGCRYVSVIEANTIASKLIEDVKFYISSNNLQKPF